MFFMSAFHGPLPERLDEFKAQVKACFPNTDIYDTKYCACARVCSWESGAHGVCTCTDRTRRAYTTTYTSTDASALEEVLGQQAALADSTVEGLYTNAVMAEPDGPGPRVRLAPGFEVRACVCVRVCRYGGHLVVSIMTQIIITNPAYAHMQKYEGAGSGEASKEFAHEAGYDAYLTGAIFVRLRAMGPDPAAVAREAAGRVFTYRSLFGLSLVGEDPRMHPKDHVFHLGIAPEAKGVKTDDLMKLFGENSIHCIVYWVNDTGAFCVVKDAAGPLETGAFSVGVRVGG